MDLRLPVIAYVLLLISAPALPAQDVLLSGERIAILRPVVGEEILSGSMTAKTENIGNFVSFVDETAQRAVPPLTKELKWPVVDYTDTISAQGAVIGSTDSKSWKMKFRQYREVAEQNNEDL